MVPLVLLPGLDGTDVFFRPLIARLPDTIRALPVCYPECGPHDYRGLLGVVRREIADLSDCYVLASSFAGPLAAMLAAAEPEKVRGIIFVATFAASPRPRITPMRFAVRGPIVGSLRFARRLPIWLLRPGKDALRIAKDETWSRVTSRSLAARARAALSADVRSELQRMQLPVLCVDYDADRVIRSPHTAEILRHCAHARRVTLRGGHLGMFSDPAPLAAEIARFVLPEAGTLRPLSAPALHAPVRA